MIRPPRLVVCFAICSCAVALLSEAAFSASNDLSAVPRGRYPANRITYKVPELKKLVDRQLKNAFLYGDFWVKEVSEGQAILQPYSGMFGLMGKVTDPQMIRQQVMQNGGLYLGATRVVLDTSTLPVALEESYPLQISADAPLELHKVSRSPSGNIVAQVSFRSAQRTTPAPEPDPASPPAAASLPAESLGAPSTGTWTVDQKSKARVWVKSVSKRRVIRWSGDRNAAGEAHGPGTLEVLFDGAPVATYTGEMRGGLLSGKVEAIYHKSRQRYSGEIAEWDENGYGTMTYADGSVKTGFWRAGELVGTADPGTPPPATAAAETPAPATEPAVLGQDLLQTEGAAFSRAAKNCLTLIRESLQPLLDQYDAKRRAIADGFQKSGDLQSLLAVKDGIEERQVRSSTIPELNDLHSSLVFQGDRIQQEIAGVALALIEERIREFTRRGDLESAQLLQAQQEEIARYAHSETRTADKGAPERLLEPKRVALIPAMNGNYHQYSQGTWFHVLPNRSGGFSLAFGPEISRGQPEGVILSDTDFAERQRIRRDALAQLRTALFFDGTLAREQALAAKRESEAKVAAALKEAETRAMAANAEKDAEALKMDAAKAAASAWTAREWGKPITEFADLVPMSAEWVATAEKIVERWDQIEASLKHLPAGEGAATMLDGCLAEVRCVRLALAFSHMAQTLKAGDAAAAQWRARSGIQRDDVEPAGERAALRKALVDAVTLLDARSAKAQEHREKAASLAKLGRNGEAIRELKTAFDVFPNPEVADLVQKLRSESLGL